MRVSNSSTSDESGRPRPQHAAHLRGLNLPHPTSPADTTHTEVLDLRRAGLVPGDPMPGNHARTQAIPLADAPDQERTDAIRRTPPAPESRAAQQNPPRDELPAAAWREWSGTNAPPGQSVPGPT